MARYSNCPFVAQKRAKKRRKREKSPNFRLKPEKLSQLNKIIRNRRSKCCLFCDLNCEDENLCGDLRHFEPLNLRVHYFCLLFSPNLTQNQNDSYGLAGFQIGKIIDEIISAQKKICIYCFKPGANARCLHKERNFECKQQEATWRFCGNNFHVACGRSNKALLQFFGSFKSYCHDHHVIPRGPWEQRRSNRWRFYGYGMVRCGICSQFLKSRADLEIFRSFCCKFAYFHAECAQKLASSAGSYALRCPLCNNGQDFQNYLLDRGVYIPIRDSMWEIDGENRYASLYERPRICSHENCPQKHFTLQDEDDDQILYCKLCGSQAVHKKCAKKCKVGKKSKSVKLEWKCQSCEDFDNRTKSKTSEEEKPENCEPVPEAKKPPKKRKSQNLKRQNSNIEHSACTSIKEIDKTIDLENETIVDAENPPKKRRKKKNRKSSADATEETASSSATTPLPKTTTTPHSSSNPIGQRRLRPLVPEGVVYAAPSPPTLNDDDYAERGGAKNGEEPLPCFWDFLRPPGQSGRLETNVQPVVAISDLGCLELEAPSPNSTSAVVNEDFEDNDSEIEILFTRIVPNS